jgi:hypothetical protein
VLWILSNWVPLCRAEASYEPTRRLGGDKWSPAHSRTNCKARGSRLPAQHGPVDCHQCPPTRVVSVEVGDWVIFLVPVHVDHHTVKRADTRHGHDASHVSCRLSGRQCVSRRSQLMQRPAGNRGSGRIDSSPPTRDSRQGSAQALQVHSEFCLHRSRNRVPRVLAMHRGQARTRSTSRSTLSTSGVASAATVSDRSVLG